MQRNKISLEWMVLVPRATTTTTSLALDGEQQQSERVAEFNYITHVYCGHHLAIHLQQQQILCILSCESLEQF